MIEESIIKDPALAPEGHRKIGWVARHAPVLNAIFEERLSDGSLEGRRVAMAIHLEAKTAYLAILLSEAGADVTVAGSNPLSTQDDVCAALAERGVRVFATHDPSEEDFEGYLLRTIETGPDLIIDDGAELVSRLVDRRPDLLAGVAGASEETTTGILKFRAMDAEGLLSFPVLAANDARMKHLFDGASPSTPRGWAPASSSASRSRSSCSRPTPRATRL
jgi:adenosylhomocysteinase